MKYVYCKKSYENEGMVFNEGYIEMLSKGDFLSLMIAGDMLQKTKWSISYLFLYREGLKADILIKIH